MAKKNTRNIIIGILAIIVILGVTTDFSIFSLLTGDEKIVRIFPTQVSPGESFTIKYQTQNAPNDNYFVVIEDTVTGGCTPTEQNIYLVEEAGGDTYKTKTFTAPSSGSCIFDGTYQYADGQEKPLATLVLTICNKINDADVSCDGTISTQELIDYAELWLDDLVSTQELLDAASIWVNQ